jgi:uncharacterized membrane protein
MTKNEFLQALADGIAGLPAEDAKHWTEYYTEMLEDRIEDGMSEEEATAALGDPAQIARQILSQIPLPKLIKNKVSPKRKLFVWEIILIVLGSPVWLSLAIAAAAVFFSFFICLWSAIACLWVCALGIAVCAPAGVILCGVQLWLGAVAQGFLLLGCGIAAAGLAVLWYYFSLWLTRLLWRFNKAFLLLVKSLFVERRAQ